MFVCFVLEHLAEPVEALRALQALLRPGGTITVIEGDHGSAYFHPDSAAAHAAIQCLVDAAGARRRRRADRPPASTRCWSSAGFDDVRVSPRMVYVDASRPDLVDGFTRKTFTAMVEGVRERAIAAGPDRRRRASTTASATSTARPRATARSATRSSRASGSVQLDLDGTPVLLVAVRDGPARAVLAAQPQRAPARPRRAGCATRSCAPATRDEQDRSPCSR